MTRAEWEYRIERKSGSATWIFLFLQRHTLRPTNFSWSELYCHRRAHGLSRLDPWRSQIQNAQLYYQLEPLILTNSPFCMRVGHANKIGGKYLSEMVWLLPRTAVHRPEWFATAQHFEKKFGCAFGAAPFVYPVQIYRRLLGAQLGKMERQWENHSPKISI